MMFVLILKVIVQKRHHLQTMTLKMIWIIKMNLLIWIIISLAIKILCLIVIYQIIILQQLTIMITGILMKMMIYLYCSSDNCYRSSNSETFSINKYKGYQEFKHNVNNSSSYCLNKNEKTKTDSQIMLFPEIAKQMNNNDNIKVYNNKPFSINSNNSTDDCSILNYSSSKLTSNPHKDIIDDQDNRSYSKNDFNGNKRLTNLIRESQYNLKNLKNLKLNDDKKPSNFAKSAVRYNSCSTLLIDNTITTADLDDTLKCVTLALLYRIRANHKKNVKLVTHKIFSEKLYPLTRHPRFSPNPPTENEIFKFLSSLFHAAE
eukprot:jgi/Orpsp1_1/1186998/evm.model.d7180000054738.1